MQSIQKDNTDPVCPHCNTTLKDIWFKALSSSFGKRYIYFCPHCHKVLGISHRKGFWMG